MARSYDYTSPCKVTITNVIDPNSEELVNKQAQTGKRRIMTLAEAKAAKITEFEYLLDKKGNFVVDPVSGADADPATELNSDDVLVVVRESIKYTDRYIQFYRTQQKILLAAGDSLVFTTHTAAEAAHYESLAVDGEITVEITGGSTEEAGSGDDVQNAVDAGKDVKLTDNANFNKPLSVGKSNITIDGNGHTMTIPVTSGTSTKDGIQIINSENVTIKNADIILTGVDKEKWQGSYGVQIFNSTAHLENVTVSGGNAGILVNSSNVTLNGNIDVSNNGFGGIEVSKGKKGDKPMLNGMNATITNSTETYGSPTIWSDGTNEIGHDCVKVKNTFTEVVDAKENQDHYYIDKKNSTQA